MKTGIFLSTTASLLLLGSTAVFAQTYAAPEAIQLKPGQTYAPAAATLPPAGQPVAAAQIVNLKPGQTAQTATPQDYAASQTASVQTPAGSFQLLKPGEAG